MKQIKILFFLLVASLICTNTGSAQDLGQGYSCSDGTLLKGAKETTVKKAKAAIQKKIEKLGNSKSDKAKKKKFNALKKAIGNCSSGGSTGGYLPTTVVAVAVSYKNGPIDRIAGYVGFIVSGQSSNPALWCVRSTGTFGDGTAFSPNVEGVGPAVNMHKNLCEHTTDTTTECANPVPSDGFGFWGNVTLATVGDTKEEVLVKAEALKGDVVITVKPRKGNEPCT